MIHQRNVCLLQNALRTCQKSVASSSSVNCCASIVTVQQRWSHRASGPPPWLPKKYASGLKSQYLTTENEAFLQELAAYEKDKKEGTAKIDSTVESKRTGLICQKIGVIPQWTNKGEKFFCTMLKRGKSFSSAKVLDNHVISYTDAETWSKHSAVGRRKAFNLDGSFGKLTVGAISDDPQKFTAAYRGLFDKSGVMPKRRLANFMVSENAKIQPGTRLHVTHFKVGQYVDITGKTIDWGFQGVMHRWGFKGQMYLWGQATKNHRRPGAIGSKGAREVFLGKRLPGHMGWEWRHHRGIQVVRINVKEEVLYVKGPAVPGDNGEILLVKDCMIPAKQVDVLPDKEPPPFPTDYRDNFDEKSVQSELFIDSLHQFRDKTIEFGEERALDIEKQLQRMKVKKQAKAKKK